jgi:hypothetical protein
MKEVKMTEVNVTTTAILSEEEAREALRAAFYDTSVETQATHEMLVDAVQFLALGGFTYDQVAGSAITAAKKENDYSIGRTFDVFTNENLAYGRKVAAAVESLKPESLVTRAMTHSGKYNKSRVQYIINSELKTDNQGRTYFEYLRRNHYVSSNVYSPAEAFETKNGTKRRLKLYADVQNQKFYIVKDGNRINVALGTTETYDEVMTWTLAAGNVEEYTKKLNNITQDLVEALADDQQMLFYEVFKAIKSSL